MLKLILKLKIIAALIALSVLLVACVPTFVDYYSPEGAGGKTISGACGTINAPKATWQYKIGSVTLEAIIDENREVLPGGFILSLWVPTGKSVSLENNEISMRTAAYPVSHKFELKRLILYEGTFKSEIKSLESLDFKGGAEGEWGVTEGRENFTLITQLQPPLEAEIFVSLPALTIEGEVFRIPEIRFMKQKRFVVYPINC